MRKHRLPAVLLLLLIILLAFVLRIWQLEASSLRGDESFTVLFVEKPFDQMWNEIRTVEPNPPLMYLLLRGWVALAGTGEFATRYFSLFWGVLCVPLLYRLAREIFGPPLHDRLAQGATRGMGVSLAAAFIIAINPYQVWHSQDVRNYTMWPALSLLALVFFWQWRNRVKAESSAPAWGQESLVPFVLAELAALYTHYYEAFILLALNLYVLMFLWRRRKEFVARGLFSTRSPVLQWISAQVVLAVFYLPFPLILSNRVSAYGEGSGKQGVALWDIWQRTFSSFTLGETQPAELRNYAWIPLAAALLVILTLFWRRERRGMFFLLYAGVPTVAVFALNVFRPLFLERYLNGIAPAYYLLFAYSLGLTTRYGRYLAYALLSLLAVLALIGLANYYVNPEFAKSPDWRGLARVIQADAQPGDVILQNFPETSLVYYTAGTMPLVVYPEEFLGSERTIPGLNNLNYRYQRIWFIPAAKDFWDPGQFVETFLDRHDELNSETQVSTFRLEQYATPAKFLKALQPSGARVGAAITLVGYRLERQDSTGRLVLYWQPQKVTKANYEVFIDQVNGSKIVAELQRPPLNGTLATSQWLKDELLVDSYEFTLDADANILQVGLYDPSAGRRLSVSDKSGQAAGDSIVISLARAK